MTSTDPQPFGVTDSGQTTPTVQRSLLVPFVLVWALFVSYSFVRAPIPAVNEPHYLGKARFWWNPVWCARDFFLQSSNPHLVFYWTVGWLTKWFTLPETAAIARVLSLGLLSGGWTALCRELFRSRWTGMLAATLFTLQMAIGNFSGEWLLGGIESKVFSYTAVLWAAAMWLRGRPILSALLAAVGVAYHPVAGMWGVISAGMVCIWRVLLDWWFASKHVDEAASSPPAAFQSREQYSLERHRHPAASKDAESSVRGSKQRGCSRGRLAVAAGVLVVGSLLALAPALPLVLGGDTELSREADRLLLTQRVGHHTDPLLFPTKAYVYYGLLLLAWFGLWVSQSQPRQFKIVQQFVAASLVIAAVGMVIGWWPEVMNAERLDPLRVWLLKFYPFRLADLALPFGVALLIASRFEGEGEFADASQQNVVTGIALVAAWMVTLSLPALDANPSGMSAEDYAAWKQVGRWVRENTPEEALIATANEDWGIKWFADRPEYVNFKDCPQDAAGVVEWWRRRQSLVTWSRSSKGDGSISADDLWKLHESTGIDYLIVSRYGPFDVEPVYRHGPFKVYATQRE